MSQEDEPMVEAAAEGEASQRPTFSLGLLKLVKTEQGQNGVKHGDYTRYRRHCTNKLRALYKVLKFQHGRTKYIKRKIEPATVTDVRFLHIPIFSAERAWAYAMELKKEIEERMDVRKRRHLISRMHKAAIWARDVARLVTETCDTRSALEADGYAAWLAGSHLLEKGGAWDKALARFTRARRVFSELGRLGTDTEVQQMCLAHVDDMDTAVRYCEHQIKYKGGAAPSAQQLKQLADEDAQMTDSDIAARLSELAKETASTQPAAAAVVLEWQGQAIPVRIDRVRAAVQQYNELCSQLPAALSAAASGAAGPAEGTSADKSAVEGGQGAKQQTPLDALLSLYDKILGQLRQARAQAQTALKSSTVVEGDASHTELTTVDRALGGLVAQRAADRAVVLVRDAEARFASSLARAAAAGTKAARKGGDKERRDAARPEDVVRVLDGLSRALAELADVGVHGGGRAGEALHDLAAAQGSVATAARCYYVAHTFLANGKALEAFALFGRAIQRCSEAEQALSDLPKASLQQQQQGSSDPSTSGTVAAGPLGLGDVKRVAQQAGVYKFVAQAEAAAEVAAEHEKVEGGVGGLSLSDTAAAAAGAEKPKYLVDALDQWGSFAGAAGGKAPRIYPLPFAMQPIPARPIMLDTAFSHISYPSIEHRLKKETKKSVLSSLAGWAWGTKK